MDQYYYTGLVANHTTSKFLQGTTVAAILLSRVEVDFNLQQMGFCVVINYFSVRFLNFKYKYQLLQ
jgi:hypothetical protein